MAMKRWWLAILCLISLAACDASTYAYRAQSTAPPAPVRASPIPTRQPAQDGAVGGPQLYPVLRVVDGDTLDVLVDGRSETLRLIGIDTPETKRPDTPVQCFGPEASRKAHELLDGWKVRIKADPTQDRRDKYGRLLAYVWRADGLFYNEWMVRHGFAHEYTYDKPYEYQRQFKQAEEYAYTHRLGFWSPQTCNGDTHKPEAQKGSSSGTYTNEQTGGPPPGRRDYDCSDFRTQAQAQKFFEAHDPRRDPYHLDGDHNGRVCESLP